MLTRFAPSPTGFLHIGNVRTALVCFLYASKAAGKFMLRIDDTDTERSKEEYVDALKRDLEWLGISWDQEARQSARMEQYATAIETLKAGGRLYACYETQQELDIKRKMQLSRGLPPLYDREALKLTDAQKAAFEAEGRIPHWRFKLEEKDVIWHDQIRGETKFSGQYASDPILVRENGAYTYMLPSTVDDIEFNISHVLRGEDHVSNTAIQIQIFEALGGTVPQFAHNALVKTAEGKLSKRKGSATVMSLREEEGLEPMAVNSFLAKVGTSDAIDIRTSMQQLIDEFDISKFGRAATTYALEDIHRLNKKLLHLLPFGEVKARLAHVGLTELDEAFWNVARQNINRLDEVKDWWVICKENLTPVIDDTAFTSEAASVLPQGEWDERTWSEWIEQVKAKTGRKGKELFMPLRKALTGMEHGPELNTLLPLIGREKTLARLSGKAA